MSIRLVCSVVLSPVAAGDFVFYGMNLVNSRQQKRRFPPGQLEWRFCFALS